MGSENWKKENQYNTYYGRERNGTDMRHDKKRPEESLVREKNGPPPGQTKPIVFSFGMFCKN